jgi:hypothetical protein
VENRPILWIVGTRLTVPERADELKRWYDEDHIPTLLQAPGVIRATRYEKLRATTDAPEHLVIYELTNEEAIEAIQNSAASQRARESRVRQWGPAGPESPFNAIWNAHYRAAGP